VSKKRETQESSSENNNHPLDLKTLKVPAVFRLLRPEFREQLKLNSCQVGIPLDQSSAPPKKERIIPIVREDNKKVESKMVENKKIENGSERLIPILVERNGTVKKDKPTEPMTSSPIRVIKGETRVTSSPIRPVVNDASTLKMITQRSPRSPVKPALPAKPLSPTRPAKVFAPKSETPGTLKYIFNSCNFLT